MAKPGESLDAPSVTVGPEKNLMVIYTSGTTGLPKGINNNHFKLLVIGLTVSRSLGLGPDDVGYACMPLFHSNAMFLGFQPAFHVGGTLSMRERFSASSFVPDVLRYGVSYWNYVGEPVHYILAAIEKEYGGDEARILREVANNPRNRLRYALGNGAAPPDIDRFMRWFALEDMLELYGSTEAAISTFRKKTDPRGSVGEITDPNVKILNESGRECPPARLDPDGKILNYAEAVGEICRVASDTALFQGYFANPEANSAKFRGNVYHSGDLGHVVDARRAALPLLRRPHRRLDPEGRRELLRGAGGAAAPGARGRDAGGGLRRALPGLGRARDGGAEAPPGRPLRSAGLLRLLRAAGDGRRHGSQVVPRLRPRGRRVRVHADAEGAGAKPEAGPLRPAPARRTRRSTGGAAATPASGPSRARTGKRCAASSRRERRTARP